MTWVVAGKHIFCTRCISDIQVTLKYPDGRIEYYDCVQKTHELSNDILISFAGSVKLSFKIVDYLKSQVGHKIRPELYSCPNEVVRKIAKSIRHLYSQHQNDTDNKVELLLQIAPTGLYTSFGVYKLKSPDFKFTAPTEPFQLLQIGNGSDNPENKKLIAKYSVGYYVIEAEGDEKPSLFIPTGKGVLDDLFLQAKECQQAGVSSSMHIFRLSHQGIYSVKYNADLLGAFPQVAVTYKELQTILRGKGVALADCYAEA